MQQNKIFPFIACCIFVLQLSCKKYLDQKSDASLVVPSTLADFQGLLDDGLTMTTSSPSLGAASSDDYFIETPYLTSKAMYEQAVYKWQPFPYYFQNDWAFAYRAVYVANLCLERLPLVSRSAANAADWDNIKGESLFFRAYNFLELAWLFGKAYDSATLGDYGIVLSETTDLNIVSVRASIKETYEKILADAKECVGLLPATAVVPTRPSRCAGYALIARTYLSMRMYDSAGRYANLAMQLTHGLMDYNDPAVVALDDFTSFQLFNKEVLFHTNLSYAVTLYLPNGGPARVDTTLYESYHINDLRKRAFFSPSGIFYRFKGTYTGSFSRTFSGIATDEVLLMRAECYARQGQKTAALNDLNELLQYRFAAGDFVSVEASTAAEALEIILQERRKELVFRGSLRWMDVKRFNKEGANITLQRKVEDVVFTLPPNDNRTALQLPQDIVEITGIPQN